MLVHKRKLWQEPVSRELRRKHRSFVPGGSKGGLYLYAVQVVEHEDKTKIGRTMSWRQRRLEYEKWNLREDGGIVRAAAFQINEEYADLELLEAELIEQLMLDYTVTRREWFHCAFDDATRAISRLLCQAEMAYTAYYEGDLSA